MATQSTDALVFSPSRLADNVTLQTPLSRYGKGPGLLLLVPKDYKSRPSTDVTKTLDPEPQQKWAEEGFTVVEVKVDPTTVEGDFKIGIEALKNLPQCSSYTTVGVIGMFSNSCLGRYLLEQSMNSQIPPRSAIFGRSQELPPS
jgi:hypothetical protein